MAPKRSVTNVENQKTQESVVSNYGSGTQQSPLNLASELSPEMKIRMTTNQHGTPTAEEFLRMILVDIKDEDVDDKGEEPTKEPTPKQISYADSLGIEMVEWEGGISVKGMSLLIDAKKEWQQNFLETHGDYPASGMNFIFDAFLICLFATVLTSIPCVRHVMVTYW